MSATAWSSGTIYQWDAVVAKIMDARGASLRPELSGEKGEMEPATIQLVEERLQELRDRVFAQIRGDDAQAQLSPFEGTNGECARACGCTSRAVARCTSVRRVFSHPSARARSAAGEIYLVKEQK